MDCHSAIIILLYSTILILTTENASLTDEENANQFIESMLPHFEQFGFPFELLELAEYEQGKEQKQLIKRNAKTRKVEWRLAEINKYTEIKEWKWTSEFSMLDERNTGIDEKKLAAAMTEYANCVKKMPNMKIDRKDETTRRIFLVNGAISILDMKPIARTDQPDQAYLVRYTPKFSSNEQQILEMPTHFCTSLFIVEIGGKIDKHELVCTPIDRWAGKNDPSKNIGKKAMDCGQSVLHDKELLVAEHLKGIGFENMLKFVQIKLAIDLEKMVERFGKDLVEGEHQKTIDSDNNVPTTAINPVVKQQIAKMDPNIRIYKGYMVKYDPRKLVADWLLERLTHDNVFPKNPIERPNLNWIADPKLEKMFQPEEEDYNIAKQKQFKLNHGHLAAFRAHRENDEQETFLYPNSVPQDQKINSGYWRVIEEYALCLAAHKKSTAYVYTGPLYIPDENRETSQWQMKYKVIGKRKMMAVPTHLFKTILLEFTNDNEKKSFWLETLVVSNGQEGEVEVDGEENIDVGGQQEEDEDEDEQFNVEVEMDNIFYNLARDEDEIEKMLQKYYSDKEKEIATTSEGVENVKKTSQKLNKGKGKKIPEAKVYVKKNIDNIQALVRSCQNRRYKINYGDKKGQIPVFLENYRKPLTYIDKFAPNFKLLAKLPPKLRSGKKESERKVVKGVHFDEDILVKLIEENEKRKEQIKFKGKRNKKDKGKRKKGLYF